MAATVWRGHLSFGLISIPVRLFRAARAERIPLRQLARVPSPAYPPEKRRLARGGKVVELPVAPAEEEPAVEPVHHSLPEEVVKGYEYGKDRWVLLGKEDLRQIAPQTSNVIDIREFVRFADIDPLYLEAPYYMAAEKSGDKAYALLYQALRDTGYAAVGDIAMHRREHVLIVRPGSRGIVAHTLYYAGEVRRAEEPQADLSLVTAKELELAQVFIRTLSAEFEPQKYKDTYRERLSALIEAKARGEQSAATAPAAPAAPEPADLVEALQRSLRAIDRKPPGTEQPTRKPRKRSGPA